MKIQSVKWTNICFFKYRRLGKRTCIYIWWNRLHMDSAVQIPPPMIYRAMKQYKNIKIICLIKFYMQDYYSIYIWHKIFECNLFGVKLNLGLWLCPCAYLSDDDENTLELIRQIKLTICYSNQKEDSQFKVWPKVKPYPLYQLTHLT